ncbi:MAG: hypothetical protein R3B72_19045 [Polyangiaceae bacterium]
MLWRARNFAKFQLERLFLQGMMVRLVLMAGLLVFISVTGGLIAGAIDPSFKSYGEAIWWAFLRLSDPGYLGDDQSLAKRIISTALTVTGYVVFVGALVAVLTQWLNRVMRDLEAGHTPIVANDHVLVIGSTTRTATIVREMLTSEGRMERFLAFHERSALQLVLLLQELSADVKSDLRDEVGPPWRESQVVLRSGSPLRIEHLRRVDFARAAAIVLPSDDLAATESEADARIIKTLLSMARPEDVDELPLVVTEVFDARKVSVARRAYAGPIEVLASDLLIARILALNLVHRGMATVLEELLAHVHGAELHVVGDAAFKGKSLRSLRSRFPRGMLLGLVRPPKEKVRFVIDPFTVVGPEDRLVVLADEHDDALPGEEVVRDFPEVDREPPPQVLERNQERLLILGWSDRVPDLVSELDHHYHGRLSVDVLAGVPIDVRLTHLEDHVMGDVRIQHFEGDVTRPSVVQRQSFGDYDKVLLVASDRASTGAHSDARTLVTYLLVRRAFEKLSTTPPRLVVELMDASNRSLIHPGVDVVVSPLIIGRVLAHVTLRPELRAIYDELLTADGPVLATRKPSAYGVADGTSTFDELRDAVLRRGEQLIGVVKDATHDCETTVDLNPVGSETYAVDDSLRLAILTDTPRVVANGHDEA